jgi:hypothetical protein
MKVRITISSFYNCSLERAFKAPLLGDVSKVHTGYGLMPRITHTADDADWGLPGSNKKLFAANSLINKGGFILVDTILERTENQYWKFQVDQFQTWMLGFHKFVGEWKTTEVQPQKIRIDYTYTLYGHTPLLSPFQWLFAQLFWKRYMKQVLENVRMIACNSEAFFFE